MSTQKLPLPTLPLKVVYNTDYLYEPDAEDLTARYVESVDDANGQTICFTDAGYFKMPAETAEFIVRACNSHDALVEALQYIASYGQDFPELGGALGDCIEIARKAIAKAEGR